MSKENKNTEPTLGKAVDFLRDSIIDIYFNGFKNGLEDDDLDLVQKRAYITEKLLATQPGDIRALITGQGPKGRTMLKDIIKEAIAEAHQKHLEHRAEQRKGTQST